MFAVKFVFLKVRELRKAAEDPQKNDPKKNDGDDDGGKEEGKKFVNVRYRQWLLDTIHGVPRVPGDTYQVPDRYPPSYLCLPPAVIECCPWCLEENLCCTLVGSLGLCGSDEAWARSAVMRYALFLNSICMLLGIYACFSFTDSHYELLTYASMAKAELTPTPKNFFTHTITLHLGLKAMTIDNPNTGVREIVRFDQFCDLLGDGLERYIQEPFNQTCHKCKDVQMQAVIGLIVAVVFVIPSMAVNCCRMYRTSDVNCVKCYMVWIQFISLVGFVLAYYQFSYGCIGAVFHVGYIAYARNGTVTTPDSISEVVKVYFDWTVGNGMVCLYAAFGFKVVDFLCNCCIPTPNITRNTYDQKVYEVKVQELLQGIDAEVGLEKDDSFSEGEE